MIVGINHIITEFCKNYLDNSIVGMNYQENYHLYLEEVLAQEYSGM